MKKEISWKGLVKITADKHKKSGKSFDFKDVLTDAGDEWKKIKTGNHPDYVVGKSAPAAGKSATKSNKKSEKKSGKSKTMKKSKSSAAASSGCDMKEIMSKCKLCKSCEAKVKKVIGGQSGGSHGLFKLSPDNFSEVGQAKAPVPAPAAPAATASCKSV
jgi:hypothetical protein